MNRANLIHWLLAVLLISMLAYGPYLYYRYSFEYAKRFRVVTDGKLYRSGQFSGRALEEIIETYGIKTVINLQWENNDPYLPRTSFGGKKQYESDICLSHNVRYIQIEPDREATKTEQDYMSETGRPYAIDQFLSLMDDPTVYPVLIHCKAGLHRTGRLTAVYRMEYEGWTMEAAMRELKANGYGDFKCGDADEFFVRYLRDYQPKKRHKPLPFLIDKKPEKREGQP